MSGQYILWIDDELDELIYEADLIKELGFEVVFASTIRSAIRILKEKAICGIIIDNYLPAEGGDLSEFKEYGENGILFIEKLMEGTLWEEQPQEVKFECIPVMLHSGIFMPKMRELSEKQVIKNLHFLDKPMNEYELRQWIERLPA